MGRLILASGSAARATMLRDAGVDVEIDPADLDEARIKQVLLPDLSQPELIAAELAKAKSQTVSRRQKDAHVIGADQVLIHNGKLLDKPKTMDEARDHLRVLKGNSHMLTSSVSVALNGTEIWSATDSADLTMRDFSEAFLTEYLETFGDTVLTSVGAYHLEGLGAQLFERIQGDYFTVLGLPLLPLLGFLRTQGILQT